MSLRRTGGLLLATVLLTTVLGCGPEVAPEDLGEVVTDPNQLPGASQPIEVPQLERAAGPEPVPEANGDEPQPVEPSE